MTMAETAQFPDDRRIADRERTFRRALRHSRIVRLSRAVIPAGSVLAVVFFVAALFLARSGVDAAIEAAAPTGLTSGRLTMEGPRLTGFQNDKRGYEVTANTASQAVKNQTKIDLAMPVARIETAAEGIAKIIAKIGVYNIKAESIDLREKVKIVTESGYTLTLDRADVDLRKGNLDSKQPVVVEMKSGRIEANSMSARDNGTSVLFSGGVTSRFENLFMPPANVGAESQAARTAQ
jgi:lipopolysaccharide export system protein LptC